MRIISLKAKPPVARSSVQEQAAAGEGCFRQRRPRQLHDRPAHPGQHPHQSHCHDGRRRGRGRQAAPGEGRLKGSPRGGCEAAVSVEGVAWELSLEGRDANGC